MPKTILRLGLLGCASRGTSQAVVLILINLDGDLYCNVIPIGIRQVNSQVFNHQSAAPFWFPNIE